MWCVCHHVLNQHLEMSSWYPTKPTLSVFLLWKQVSRPCWHFEFPFIKLKSFTEPVLVCKMPRHHPPLINASLTVEPHS